MDFTFSVSRSFIAFSLKCWRESKVNDIALNFWAIIFSLNSYIFQNSDDSDACVADHLQRNVRLSLKGHSAESAQNGILLFYDVHDVSE